MVLAYLARDSPWQEYPYNFLKISVYFACLVSRSFLDVQINGKYDQITEFLDQKVLLFVLIPHFFGRINPVHSSMSRLSEYMTKLRDFLSRFHIILS